jgi:citrate lyase subunit beta / citryl-CoA lyase
MRTPRTYLFVPGNRPDRFDKALASGADAIVLDLEDAVSDDAKDTARTAVGQWAASCEPSDRTRIVVRINDAESTQFEHDLAMLAATGLSTVMLPKTESPAQVTHVQASTGSPNVLALIETARGVDQVDAIAAADGVTRLVFGTLDLAVDLDLDIEHSLDGLTYAAGRLTVASRLAGLAAPVAGVTPQLEDRDRLLSNLAWSRRHGFDAKLCIHPDQVEPIHDALTPDSAALDWAHRVLAADRASAGAARLDGRMIDRPVVLAARRTVARAGPPDRDAGPTPEQSSSTTTTSKAHSATRCIE